MSENVSHLRDNADPVQRAIFWLTDLSWRDPDHFETVQNLVAELQALRGAPHREGTPNE